MRGRRSGRLADWSSENQSVIVRIARQHHCRIGNQEMQYGRIIATKAEATLKNRAGPKETGHGTVNVRDYAM
ncbi:MAG: hypothetical protein DRH97_01740 [Chloroflexi bacterium]|nr:MAG: hypothetical protein DRH97_01740 [Chloroflexota bacterium]